MPKHGMSNGLTYDFQRIAKFVQSRVPLALSERMQAIGWERDGQVVAGALYEGFDGLNIWVHLAAEPGRHWLSRNFLRAGFAYPFVVCGVQRLWGRVDASNSEAVRFNLHLGYQEITRLPGAAADGGDVVIFMMKKEDCKYV